MNAKSLMHVRTSLALIVAFGVLLAFPATKSFAYGAADQPAAQLEFSGNCDSTSFPLCSLVGIGGIWVWIEADANGTADYSGAACGHTVGGIGGPGGAGAGSIRGTGTWVYSTGVPAGAAPVGQDPNNQYYVVTLATGQEFAFPETLGHYSFHPVPGVSLEATVAP
jgi:hypothetical protein